MYCPAVVRTVASGMIPKHYVGRYHGHHGRTGSILIMTTDVVVKAACFFRMNVESTWNVDSWCAPRGLLWDVNGRGANAAEAIQAQMFSSGPPLLGATSALRHEGRLEKVRCDSWRCNMF